jgi:hypothetical protein
MNVESLIVQKKPKRAKKEKIEIEKKSLMML